MKSPQDPADTPVTLGTPVREAKPTPAPAPVTPGVVRNPDGTLSTALPDPAPVYFGGATFFGFTPEEAQALAAAVRTVSACHACGADRMRRCGVLACGNLDCRG